MFAFLTAFERALFVLTPNYASCVFLLFPSLLLEDTIELEHVPPAYSGKTRACGDEPREVSKVPVLSQRGYGHPAPSPNKKCTC